MENKKKISLIAAIGRNRELGKGRDLLWPIPDDLKRFKEITTGHAIIMGHKTYESIGRPLPKRQNIVISRDTDLTIDGVEVVHSLEEAVEAAEGEEIFVIGGGLIYALALPYANKLYMTLIDAEEPDADVFFPEYEHIFTKKHFIEKRNHEGLSYSWINFEK